VAQSQDSKMVLRARRVGFRDCSDPVTEVALGWNLTKHCHPLNVVLANCEWCKIERVILKVGVKSLSQTPPHWWKTFISEAFKEMDHSPMIGDHRTALLRVDSSDGRWWVFPVAEQVSLFYSSRAKKKSWTVSPFSWGKPRGTRYVCWELAWKAGRARRT
jgi:hypothetical protein